MATFSYTYSVNSGFATNANVTLLTSDIQGSSISATLNTINIVGDSLEFVFNSSLSNGDISTLTSIIKARDNATPLGSNQMILTTRILTVNGSTYQSIGNLVFPGASSVQNVTHVKVVSCMDLGGTSYDLRLYDISNNVSLASGTFTNTDPAINEIAINGTFSSSPSILELQCRVSGVTTATISTMIIYYE